MKKQANNVVETPALRGGYDQFKGKQCPTFCPTWRGCVSADATIIYHRADYDGQLSGAVCAMFLQPKAENVIGWDFGDPLLEFPSEGPVYVVDLSPDCFASIPDDATSRLIWIDHHKSSIEKWGEQFPGYRIDGVAACRLCWQWFNYDRENGGIGWVLPKLSEYQSREVDEPLVLTLAGEYDVWDRRDANAEQLQYGMTANGVKWPANAYSLVRLLGDIEAVSRSLADKATRELVEQGRAAQKWHQEFAADVCKERAYQVEWEGLTFYTLSGVHVRNSLWFHNVPDDCGALMAWRYSGDGFVRFSLYHKPGREDIDLSLIARKYGGGGHRGACGFEMEAMLAFEVIQ